MWQVTAPDSGRASRWWARWLRHTRGELLPEPFRAHFLSFGPLSYRLKPHRKHKRGRRMVRFPEVVGVLTIRLSESQSVSSPRPLRCSSPHKASRSQANRCNILPHWIPTCWASRCRIHPAGPVDSASRSGNDECLIGLVGGNSSLFQATTCLTWGTTNPFLVSQGVGLEPEPPISKRGHPVS
jgi:hypothetical protein